MIAVTISNDNIDDNDRKKSESNETENLCIMKDKDIYGTY